MIVPRKYSRLRLTRFLNTAANCALVIAAIAVTISSALDIHSRLSQGKPRLAPRPAAALKSGTRAPTVAGLNYAESDRTLVLFLSTHCNYCTKSVPFYRDLSSRVAGKKQSTFGTRRLVAVFAQSNEDVAAFKKRTNLDIEAVTNVSVEEAVVPGTPTVVLVSRDGVILQSWVGSASKETESAIIQAFTAG